MENITDQELVDRIRRSDRLAFFLFLKRHWKTQYAEALRAYGDEEHAFEQVYRLFESMWDRRSRLPALDAGVGAYLKGLPARWDAGQLIENNARFPATPAFRVDLGRYSEGWGRELALKTNGKKQ